MVPVTYSLKKCTRLFFVLLWRQSKQSTEHFSYYSKCGIWNILRTKFSILEWIILNVWHFSSRILLFHHMTTSPISSSIFSLFQCVMLLSPSFLRQRRLANQNREEKGGSGGGGGGGGVCPRGRERGERGGASGDFASPYYTLLYFGRGGISTMVQK